MAYTKFSLYEGYSVPHTIFRREPVLLSVSMTVGRRYYYHIKGIGARNRRKCCPFCMHCLLATHVNICRKHCALFWQPIQWIDTAKCSSSDSEGSHCSSNACPVSAWIEPQLYAIAYATHLAHGLDPTKQNLTRERCGNISWSVSGRKTITRAARLDTIIIL